MPFEIVRNDIVNMQVDAIVNSASPNPVIGYGADSGIHLAAGPELLKARQEIGRIRVGDAAITPGFGLKARYVIHAVGPVWQDGNHREERLLRSCYQQSLKIAHRRGLQSVAFPLMGAGNHGFPKELALRIALDAIGAFLLKHDMRVFLVVFSREAFRLSEGVQQGIASYIDENYVQEKNLQQYGVADKCAVRDQEQIPFLEAQRDMDLWNDATLPSMQMPPACPAPKARRGFSLPLPKARPTLSELLEQTDAGFSETLLKLIDRTGKKDSEVYARANVSRQHFSKIRNNPDYKPTKATAIAFAIALELDLEQTRDLIGRAGYALTNSSKFDVIIMYFISQGIFNLFDINAALFEYDQSLLGS